MTPIKRRLVKIGNTAVNTEAVIFAQLIEREKGLGKALILTVPETKPWETGVVEDHGCIVSNQVFIFEGHPAFQEIREEWGL